MEQKISTKQIVTKIDEILNSIKENLNSRKHRNWIDDPISVLLEEILCSMEIHSIQKGFELTYKCKADSVIASFPKDINHMKHCLWEILCYLELSDAKRSFLPVRHDLRQLKQSIKTLLQLISPDDKTVNKCLVI